MIQEEDWGGHPVTIRNLLRHRQRCRCHYTMTTIQNTKYKTMVAREGFEPSLPSL